MAYELCTRAGLKEMIRAGCPGRDPLIALKPNLVGPIPAEEGATTHPEIVEGVVSYLKDSGFSNLSVMESSWVGDKTTDALLVTGFGDLCKRLGVPFYDLQSDKGIPVDCAGMRINICAKVLKVDYLINLPVMKGHCQTRMTCALKNLKGCIPASEKRRFHRMGLHEPIGHLGAGLKQDFILADAICPDLTFEDGGNPVPMDRMLCAVDPVLLDAYACSLMGPDRDHIGHVMNGGPSAQAPDPPSDWPYITEEGNKSYIKNMQAGSTCAFRSFSFGQDRYQITIEARGRGVLEVHFDQEKSPVASTLTVDSGDWAKCADELTASSGVHALSFTVKEGQVDLAGFELDGLPE